MAVTKLVKTLRNSLKIIQAKEKGFYEIKL